MLYIVILYSVGLKMHISVFFCVDVCLAYATWHSHVCLVEFIINLHDSII